MNHGTGNSWLGWDCLSEFKAVKNVTGNLRAQTRIAWQRYRVSIVNTCLGFEPRQVPSTHSQI
jgi:hypothetical protein